MSQADGPAPPRPRSLSSELDEALEDVSPESLLNTAFLVGLSGKRAGKLFRIRAGDNIIGRTSKAFLTLDEKAVSHQHALLHLSSRGCFVSDLQSTNGTYVNDVKISTPTPLQAGDVVRIGNSTLGFLTDAEDDEQHTRALARVTAAHTAVGLGTSTPGKEQLVVAPTGAHVVSPVVARPSQSVPPPAGPPASGLDNALDKLSLAVDFLGTYWKLLLLCAALLGALGGGTVAFFPPKAVAEFEIFLRHDRTQNPTQHFASRGIDFFVSAEKNFGNRDVVKKTMEDMGMPTNGNSIVGTANGLTFGMIAQNTYRGTYAHTDASFAEKFLAQHVQNYLEREIGKSISVLRSEVNLLQEQYNQNEEKLREMEAKMRDFKLEHLDALPDHAEGQIASRVSLMTQRDGLSADLERYTRELELAKKQLASEDALVETRVRQSEPYDAELANVRKNIAAARAQGFSDGHPDMVKYRSQEQELLDLRRRTIETETTETDRRANPEHKRLRNKVGELEVAVATTSKELGLVQSRLGEISKIAGDLPKVEADFAELTRQVDQGQQLHSRLYEQLKAKQLQLEFERASVAARYEVVKPPSAWPVSPVKTAAMRAAAGSLVGLLVGLAIAAAHWLVLYARNRRREEQVTSSSETSLSKTS